MARIEGSVFIGRGPEDVFDFVADARNEPRFNPGMVACELVGDGTVQAGSRFQATFETFGRAVPMRVELTAFDRPGRLGSRSRVAGTTIEGELAFLPDGDGTRLAWTWRLSSDRLARVVDPVLATLGRTQERRIWGNLKMLLEQGEDRRPPSEPAAGPPSPAARHGALARGLLRAPAALYRWDLGWLLGSHFVLVAHVGRRSGRRREAVVEVVQRRPGGEVVVMSGWGASADWYRNVLARPTTELQLGRRRLLATHRVLPLDEAAAALASYEHRYRAARPVVQAVLSRLVGWRYDGSAEARQRLVEQRPMLAFRPVGP